MSDQTNSASQTPDGDQNTASQTGLLPFFQKGARPGDGPMITFAKDMNRLVSLLRALQKLKVTRTDAEPNSDGTFTSDAKFTLTEQNALLELFDVPSGTGGGGGTVNIVPMQVVSYTTTDDYLSAKNGRFTGAGTFTATGSAVNVALPWELRTAQSPGSGYAIAQPYAANDIIFVIQTDAGDNGVYVSAVELTLMDLGLGRTWSKPGTQAQDFTLVSVQGDYITATNNSTSASTLIAKPYKLRNSITAQTIDGVAYTYTYTSSTQRTAATSGYSEYQRIVERYLVGDQIWADQPSATGVTVSGTPLVWMDTNRDGREWASRKDQSGP